MAFHVDYHSKSQRLRSMLSIRNIIAMKVTANVKMVVVLSIWFHLICNWCCAWKLNQVINFKWKPMMTVESCHQRWQGGLRGGWIWSWCWTHHWSCEARITRPDQARPNTGSLRAQHLFHPSHRRQLCAMNPCIGCFADRYWSDYLFSLTPPGV